MSHRLAKALAFSWWRHKVEIHELQNRRDSDLKQPSSISIYSEIKAHHTCGEPH